MHEEGVRQHYLHFSAIIDDPFYRSRMIPLSLVQDDPDFMTEPLSRVVVTQLNDYNVTLELQVCLDNQREHVKKITEPIMRSR